MFIMSPVAMAIKISLLSVYKVLESLIPILAGVGLVALFFVAILPTTKPALNRALTTRVRHVRRARMSFQRKKFYQT